MGKQIIDSHAHLTDKKFDITRCDIIKEMKNDGISLIINPGCDEQTSIEAMKLSENNDNIFATVGFHPHDAKAFQPKHEQDLKKWLKMEKVIALGEIGLDFFYDFSPREIQKCTFEKQLLIAYESNKPVVIHMRDATKECLDILKCNKKNLTGGVIHCFSGSKEIAKEFLNLGYHISFAGPLTYKNAQSVRECANFVPIDKILLETDSPYLSPAPHRGEVNQPKNIWHTAKVLSELKGLSIDEVSLITSETTKNLFRINL